MCEITKEIRNVTAKVGMMSLVGIMGKEYPLSFGNYFAFSNGLYCVNMWAENLEEIVKRNKIDTVECTVFSDGKHQLAFVTDKRIPPNWLIQNRLCVTGHGWGSRKLCEACLAFAGYSIKNHISG